MVGLQGLLQDGDFVAIIDGMKAAIRVTIDASGRLVIPKSVRDAVGWRAGTPLELVLRDGSVELRPVPRELVFEDRGGVHVALPATTGGEELSVELVESVRQAVREGRY